MQLVMAGDSALEANFDEKFDFLSPSKFTGRLSISFQDFGKESLGILPSNFDENLFGTLDTSASRRHSTSFKNILDIPEYGRESLICGKESLGILDVNAVNITIEENDFDNKFNNAYLWSSCIENSFISSDISFHPDSFNIPSKIYRPSQNCSIESFSYSCDILNKAIINSPSRLDKVHSRALSVPEPLGQRLKITSKKLWSLGDIQEAKRFGKDDDNFNDSVFIEARYIARGIADGSILEEAGVDNILDGTQQPDWSEILDNSAEKLVPNAQTEEILKRINKFFPEPAKSNYSSQWSSSNCSKHAKEMLQSLSEILNKTNHSDLQKSEGFKLINSLAEILCDKSNSNSRINNLDDSGHSSFIEQTEDSEKEIYECYEMLPLTKTSLNASKKRADASEDFYAAAKIPEQRLSKSFSTGSQCSTVVKKNTSLCKAAATKPMRETKTSEVAGSVLIHSLATKPRISCIKKGPLKVTIPVTNMKGSRSNVVTPERDLQKCNPLVSKRTSTPILEPKLKPVAASTPSNQTLNKDNIAVFPTTRRSAPSMSLNQNKQILKESNRPSTMMSKISVTNLASSVRKNTEAKLFRGSSFTETSVKSIPRIARSNSLDKNMDLSLLNKRVRSNLLPDKFQPFKFQLPRLKKTGKEN